MSKDTRWGIVGAGKICHDFVCAIGTLKNSDKHKLIAVAARDLSRAQKFAELHKFQNAYGSYQELAKDKNVGMWVIHS